MNKLVNAVTSSVDMTISSLELCKLIKYDNHTYAKKKITKLIETKEFGTAQIKLDQLPTGNGGIQNVEAYQLNKNQSLIVAAQLNNLFLIKVIERWQELESQNTFKVPSTFIEAMELATEVLKQNEALRLENEAKAKQIELEAPKVAYVNQIINDEESLSIGDFAKLLSRENGCMIKVNSLFEFLRQSNYTFSNLLFDDVTIIFCFLFVILVLRTNSWFSLLVIGITSPHNHT